MITKTSYVRLGAFAAVLLLSSALLVTLFDEASAATIDVNTNGTASGGSHDITVDIVVPDGQRVPIEKLTAAIETRANPDDETKTSASEVSLASLASCDSVIAGCPPGPIDEIDGTAGVLIEVKFNHARVDGVDIDGYFDTGPLNVVHEGGYGYHPVAGYGYGGVDPAPDPGPDNGYGYGYSGDDLTLSFTFTISPNTLGNGDYWFTALAETGSPTIDDLSSPATPFTVSSGGGGGGGGGDDTTTPPKIPSGSDQVVVAVAIALPDGALEAWQAIVTGEAGEVISILTGSDQVPQVDFTLENDVTDAEIDVVIWPRDNFPPGVDAPTWVGVNTAIVIQINISDSSTGNLITVWVQISEADMEGNNPGQAFSAKHTNPWNLIGKMDLEHNETGERWEGSFSSTCCSTYLVGFDEDDPTVSLSADATSVLEGETITFTAQADDNVELDRVEFYLGDDLMHTATSAPFTWEWTTTSTNIGNHTVDARAYDFVGNSAQDDEDVEVQQDDTTTTPGPEDDTPFPWWIVILLAAVVVIGGAVWYFASQRKGAN